MKRLTAITVLCVLFLSAFAAGKGPAGAPRPFDPVDRYEWQ